MNDLKTTETTDFQRAKTFHQAVCHSCYATDVLNKASFHTPEKQYFSKALVVFLGDVSVGFVAAYNNPDIEVEGQKATCFGSFECINNTEIAHLLLNFVSREAAKMGATKLIGPISGSTWHHYRFILDNQHPTFALEAYNNLYYNKLLKNNGFQIVAKYYSVVDENLLVDAEEYRRLEAYFAAKGARIRHPNFENFEGELARIGNLSIATFAQNAFFSPIETKDFIAQYTPYIALLAPEFIYLVEDKKNNLQAFLFALPDLSNPKSKTLIIKSIARATQSPFRGITRFLALMAYRDAKAKGFTKAIHAFMHQNNASRHISAKFNTHVYREYALYNKSLG